MSQKSRTSIHKISYELIKEVIGTYELKAPIPAYGAQLSGDRDHELHGKLIFALEDDVVISPSSSSFQQQVLQNMQHNPNQRQMLAAGRQMGKTTAARAMMQGAGGVLGGNQQQQQQQQQSARMQRANNFPVQFQTVKFVNGSEALILNKDGTLKNPYYKDDLNTSFILYMNKVNRSTCHVTHPKGFKDLVNGDRQISYGYRVIGPSIFNSNNRFEVGEKVHILPLKHVVPQLLGKDFKQQRELASYPFFTKKMEEANDSALFLLAEEFTIVGVRSDQPVREHENWPTYRLKSKYTKEFYAPPSAMCRRHDIPQCLK